MMRHDSGCKKRNPNCPCNTCRRDNAHKENDIIGDWPCCCRKQHRRKCDDIEPCKDYIPEKKSPPKRTTRKNNSTHILTGGGDKVKCINVNDANKFSEIPK